MNNVCDIVVMSSDFFDVQGSIKGNVNFSLKIHEYINDWIKTPIPRLAIASSFHYQY